METYYVSRRMARLSCPGAVEFWIHKPVSSCFEWKCASLDDVLGYLRPDVFRDIYGWLPKLVNDEIAGELWRIDGTERMRLWPTDCLTPEVADELRTASHRVVAKKVLDAEAKLDGLIESHCSLVQDVVNLGVDVTALEGRLTALEEKNCGADKLRIEVSIKKPVFEWWKHTNGKA